MIVMRTGQQTLYMTLYDATYKVGGKRDLKAVFRKTEGISAFENSQKVEMTPRNDRICLGFRNPPFLNLTHIGQD